MTRAERDALEALAREATPGPITTERGLEGYKIRTLRGLLCDGMTGPDVAAVVIQLRAIPLLLARIERLEKALRGAQLNTECPCCLEMDACLDDCEHEATDPKGYARLQWQRQHNAEIDAALEDDKP